MVRMQVTLQASPAVADALRGQAPATPESQAVAHLARAAGAKLRALHDETADPTLSTYFIVDVADDATATHIIELLRRSPGIVAAYVKPPEALP